MSEHDEQVALFDWVKLYAREEPRLRTMFAIPNQGGQGKGAIIRGKKMVREGLRKGVPDIFLPVVTHEFGGLFIEMKSEKGRPSEEQIEYLNMLTEAGYLCGICHSFEQARSLIMDYLNSELDLSNPEDVRFNYFS
tara:strand:- start:2779 stop:3186 length:408 start_codon:yes stop_codon:yes gene_type:complete